jgi:NitT/TauT family transport system substrate-binding protein
VRYVATICRLPEHRLRQASSGSPAGRPEGQEAGHPGKYGSSWSCIQALLASAASPADLVAVEFPGYGQDVAVREGVVDAATGFVNNEPVQLELSGENVVVLTVDAITPLPGPGLITGEATLAGPKQAALKAFVAATLRAMKEIAADPRKGGTRRSQPCRSWPTTATQLAVLDATVDAWRSSYTEANGWGAVDEGAWTRSIDFMSGLPDSPVAKPVTVDQLVSKELLP